MTLYELTKKYGVGKGEDTMWHTVKVMSDYLEDNLSEKELRKLLRKIYGEMSSGHYDEEYAKEDIAKMYYIDRAGEPQYGPYWSYDTIKAVYEPVKSKIPGYNMWDFAVTMSMLRSDMCGLLREWFPSMTESQLTERLIELTINWLDDDDSPYGDEKIWGYLNSD